MAEPDVTCPSDSQHTSDPMDFWKNTLNSAKYVVAPMVDQSELAWRLLSRRHGAQLCYSPMYHAPVFIRDSNYRTEALATCDEDRPLIIQFCANNPEVLLKAAKYAQDHCDAIDLNIGCPQAIAKRGHYGAFLQDEWDLLQTMVSQCAKELRVPITCKIRIFDDVEKTVEYALMLESAGCKLLTVHGRTREQKGPFTGIASWTHIRAVRDAIKIPMFANGNIQYLDDVHRCIAETNVQGVMSAEGNLHNPALFEGTQVPCWELSEEYLELVEKYPCPNSYVRGHLFKMCHHALLMHTEVRDQLASVKKLSEFKPVITNLKKACETDVEDHKSSNPDSYTQKLPHPYWLCQPYVRPCPKDSDDLPNNHEKRSRGTPSPDGYEDRVSKNKLKKLRRNPNKNFVPKGEQYEKCKCGNPRGMKCEYKLCKNCCWQHAKEQINDCAGHKILLKTLHKRRKEIAKNKGHDEPDNHCNKDAENCVSREHVDKESDINLPDPTDCCGNR